MKEKRKHEPAIFTILDFIAVFITKLFEVLFEILGGMLKLVATILGVLFAPQATGDLIVATRQRKQRKRIEALEEEIEKLKKS